MADLSGVAIATIRSQAGRRPVKELAERFGLTEREVVEIQQRKNDDRQNEGSTDSTRS